MNFKVEQEIFEKLPNACFGVVVAKGIDNTKDLSLIHICGQCVGPYLKVL